TSPLCSRLHPLAWGCGECDSLWCHLLEQVGTGEVRLAELVKGTVTDALHRALGHAEPLCQFPVAHPLPVEAVHHFPLLVRELVHEFYENEALSLARHHRPTLRSSQCHVRTPATNPLAPAEAETKREKVGRRSRERSATTS